jgi:hypothetical protein
MRDITKFETVGRNSLAKARRVKPRAYRRKAAGYLAFTIKSARADGSRYVVRIASEGRKVLAECVDATTGDPCQGFYFSGHCYHVGRALLLASK